MTPVTGLEARLLNVELQRTQNQIVSLGERAVRRLAHQPDTTSLTAAIGMNQLRQRQGFLLTGTELSGGAVGFMLDPEFVLGDLSPRGYMGYSISYLAVQETPSRRLVLQLQGTIGGIAITSQASSNFCVFYAGKRYLGGNATRVNSTNNGIPVSSFTWVDASLPFPGVNTFVGMSRQDV